MLDPARLLALLKTRQVEWALEGVRYSNRDDPPEFAFGAVVGRNEAIQLVIADVEHMLAEDEDREKER